METPEKDELHEREMNRYGPASTFLFLRVLMVLPKHRHKHHHTNALHQINHRPPETWQAVQERRQAKKPKTVFFASPQPFLERAL